MATRDDIVVLGGNRRRLQTCVGRIRRYELLPQGHPTSVLHPIARARYGHNARRSILRALGGLTYICMRVLSDVFHRRERPPRRAKYVEHGQIRLRSETCGPTLHILSVRSDANHRKPGAGGTTAQTVVKICRVSRRFAQSCRRLRWLALPLTRSNQRSAAPPSAGYPSVVRSRSAAPCSREVAVLGRRHARAFPAHRSRTCG